MRSKYRDEVVIASFFILLCLHFAVHRFVRIYPSVVFPAFSKAPVTKDFIPYRTMHLYALKSDGSSVEINPDHFLAGYADYTNFSLRTIMDHEKVYKKDKILNGKRNDFIRFAKAQLLKLYPGENYLGLKIENCSNGYFIASRKKRRNVEKPENTIIPLNEPAP